MLLFTVTSAANVSAWCVAGIGNTCGDSSRESGFFSRYFNVNEPAPSDSFDVWGIGGAISNTVNNLFDRPNNDVDNKPLFPDRSTYNTGDKMISTDSFGDKTVTTVTEVTNVQVGAEDPWYYDVDVAGIVGHQCIGCPDKYGDIPGFDYEFYISLRNTGNVPVSDNFRVEVIGEDLNEKRLYYNQITHVPGFPTGVGIINVKLYDIGYDSATKTFYPEAVYSGVFDDPELNFRVTVNLYDDDKETEPGFVEYVNSVRECSIIEDSQGFERTYCDVTQELVKEPIHAVYEDNKFQDSGNYTFIITKLSPDIVGDGGFEILR